MKTASPARLESIQPTFFSWTLREQLDPREPLYKLAEAMDWAGFERDFSYFYSDRGRPAKPIRRMLGLLIIEQIHDLSDEAVVAQCKQNVYFQFFCGNEEISHKAPCDSSDLAYFRKRIREQGAAKIFEASVRLHGKAAQQKVLIADTTVQEKNITYPTNTKAALKIIEKVRKIVKKQGIRLRRSYTRTIPKLRQKLRFKRTKKAKEGRAAKHNKIGCVDILTPRHSAKNATNYQRRKMRHLFCRRVTIEPTIGHLKNDYRLRRNYLKGTHGDTINLSLAAAYNYKKWLNTAIFLPILRYLSAIVTKLTKATPFFLQHPTPNSLNQLSAATPQFC